MFLLHGPRRQNLDLFIYRIWRYWAELCPRPHQIQAIPFRRFFARPRSVPEWENHVRYALGGEHQSGTAAKLLRDAARQSAVLLVLGEVPIEAGRLDEVECQAFVDFVRGRLPTLITQAAEGVHPVRVLIATHYERAGDSWVDTLDQALVGGAIGGDPRYLKLPALQPLMWTDIVEFLDQLTPRPPRHIYRQLHDAWERLDQGDLAFREDRRPLEARVVLSPPHDRDRDRQEEPMVELPYRAGLPRLTDAGMRGRDGRPYQAHPDLLAAANVALELGMPLLLTGEPGCGKTDFAFAAASGLGWGAPLEAHVRSDTRAHDLLYHYDVLRRFGDAQHGGVAGVGRAQDPRPYIDLRPLGKALLSPVPQVVLIDEIDKAPRDLPNDLLRELDQGHFEIPEISDASADERADSTVAGFTLPPIDLDDRATYRRTMVPPAGRACSPLTIITSNVERQLPDPFLRRCVFFHIPFPDDDQLRAILVSWLADQDAPPDLMIDRALTVFSALRGVPSLIKRPSTSELIRWVEALHRLHEPALVVRALERLDLNAGRPDWRALPALSCLIKLREDLGRLRDGL